MLAMRVLSGKDNATLQGAITVADSKSSPEVVGVCRSRGPLLGRMAKLNLVLTMGLPGLVRLSD
jgi:hypothetical protein